MNKIPNWCWLITSVCFVVMSFVAAGYESQAKYWRKQYDVHNSSCIDTISNVRSDASQVHGSSTMGIGTSWINDEPGVRHPIVSQDISVLARMCKKHQSRTYLLSNDSSWDIPIDCRRLLQQYAKEKVSR